MLDSYLMNYTAKVGGIIYRNVRSPITLNGEPLLWLERNVETGQLGVSFDLRTQEQEEIAIMRGGSLTVSNMSEFYELRGLDRVSLVHKESGRVWCDVRSSSKFPEYELDCSCVLFGRTGYPVLLHPDRSKFGQANDNAPPNIAGLTLTTDPDSDASAVGLTDGSLYLLNVAIENFNCGIAITHTMENDAQN